MESSRLCIYLKFNFVPPKKIEKNMQKRISCTSLKIQDLSKVQSNMKKDASIFFIF